MKGGSYLCTPKKKKKKRGNIIERLKLEWDEFYYTLCYSLTTHDLIYVPPFLLVKFIFLEPKNVWASRDDLGSRSKET